MLPIYHKFKWQVGSIICNSHNLLMTLKNIKRNLSLCHTDTPWSVSKPTQSEVLVVSEGIMWLSQGCRGEFFDG